MAYRNTRDKERTPYKRQKVARIVDVPMGMPQQAMRSTYIPRGLSGTSQQAMRTGGWADPVRGGEMKFVDVSVSAATAIGAATFSAAQLLNGIQQGSDATNRVGRKINLKSLYLRYNFSLSATSTNGGTCRILVVYDKQANAAAPAITDILLADAFTSPNNLSNRDRFVTLVDHVTPSIGTAANWAVADVCYRKINLETMFNSGNAGTIGDITSGSVYCFYAQSGAIGTAAPALTYRARIKFTDV